MPTPTDTVGFESADSMDSCSGLATGERVRHGLPDSDGGTHNGPHSRAALR